MELACRDAGLAALSLAFGARVQASPGWSSLSIPELQQDEIWLPSESHKAVLELPVKPRNPYTLSFKPKTNYTDLNSTSQTPHPSIPQESESASGLEGAICQSSAKDPRIVQPCSPGIPLVALPDFVL